MRLTESQLRNLIRKSVRRALLEAEDTPASVISSDEAGIEWGSNYMAFINALQSGASDPKVQAFIAAGKLDQNENDDKFKFGSANLSVAGLKPTQNEIDVDKSLGWPMKKADTFISYVKGSGQTFTLGGPIVTYAGQYIIDGHHRWSQLYACNKDAKISAIDITAEGLEPLDVLKAVQAAIAIQTKTVPVQSVEGQNLLKIDESGLTAWIESKVKEEFFAAVEADEAAMKVLGGTDANPTTVAAYIWANVQDMQAQSQPVPGAPKRDFMPQTDNVDWKSPLEAGLVDIVPPHAGEVKKESRARRGDLVVLERWQKLAGLIKG